MVKMRLLASLFLLVLFLFMTNLCVGASGRKMIVVFKGNQTAVSLKGDDTAITKSKPPGFRIPAFVGGTFNSKEFLMVLCGTRSDKTSGNSIIDAAFRTSYGGYTTWSDAEIIATKTSRSTAKSVVGDFTAVNKGNKIYVLASSWDELDNDWLIKGDNSKWDPLMIVGTVMNHEKSTGVAGVQVNWGNGVSLRSLLPNKVLDSTGFRFVGGVGNGVVTKSGAIIFPIQIANNNRKHTASIMYSTDDGSSWHIGGTTEEGTSEGSVTEWGDGKLILSVEYSGFQKVYESDDMGATWKESVMFSRVWGNQPNRLFTGGQGSVITVPVDGKDILLFSHPLNKLGSYKRDTLQLWMSDGQRIKCVGTISENGKGERSGNSILAHVGDHLYVVHEINPYGERKSTSSRSTTHRSTQWDGVIALSSLPDLFDSVKSTVLAWQQVDEELSAQNIPTNGLVGFLSDSNSNNLWEDKYNCVHATVKGGTRVKGGFRFDGKENSVAKWPVKSQEQNQYYIFTETQFTLAATVKIDSARGCGYHLLLGASQDARGKSLMIGLGRTRGNTWYILTEGGSEMSTGVSLEIGKEYHVAMTFNGETVSVYVDGESIISGRQPTYEKPSISHFFMGSIGISSFEDGCVTTVKNVMLFNQVVKQIESPEIKTVDKNDGSKTSTRTTKNPKTDSEDREEDFKDDETPPNRRRSRKKKRRSDGTVQSISFAAWICLVYSAIVLAVL